MILDGKKIAKEILEALSLEIQHKNFKRPPCLACILIGDDPASATYVKMKQKRCSDIGIKSTLYKVESSYSENDLLQLIQSLNNANDVDGILIQQPMPKHISYKRVINQISPAKDVDGFHPVNMGKLLVSDDSGFVPCTPRGIRKLLHEYEIDLTGKHVAILGRSNIVGRPLAALLSQNLPYLNATVTTIHSKSDKKEDILRTADVVIAAMGKPHYVKKSMLKKDSIVIDVGITKVDGKILGDVDPKDLDGYVKARSTVPGGIGPMTIAMLLSNTYLSFIRKQP